MESEKIYNEIAKQVLDMYQIYANKVYFSYAKSLMDYLNNKEKFTNQQANEFVLALIACTVCKDGMVANKEYEAFCSVIGNRIPFDDFYKIVVPYNKTGFYDLLFSIFKDFKYEETFLNSICLAACFSISDGKIDNKEKDFLLKLCSIYENKF